MGVIWLEDCWERKGKRSRDMAQETRTGWVGGAVLRLMFQMLNASWNLMIGMVPSGWAHSLLIAAASTLNDLRDRQDDS